MIKPTLSRLPEPQQTQSLSNLQKREINILDYKDLSEKDKEELKQLGIDDQSLKYEVYSPILDIQDQLSKTKKKTLTPKEYYYKFINSFKPIKKALSSLFLIILEISVVLMVILRFTNKWGYIRFISGYMLTFSNLILGALSFLALVIAVIVRSNLWIDIGYIFFWVPIGLLCLGAISGRIVDMNFPIWKTIYSSLSLPVMSGIGISTMKMFF